MQALRRVFGRFVPAFVADERGVDLIEYGLLASLIAVVVVASVKSVGLAVIKMFTSIQASI